MQESRDRRLSSFKTKVENTLFLLPVVIMLHPQLQIENSSTRSASYSQSRPSMFNYGTQSIDLRAAMDIPEKHTQTTESTGTTEYKSPKLWLAISALLIALLTLTCSILLVFVVLPNSECTCPPPGDMRNSGALSTESSRMMSTSSISTNPTVIVNETHIYIQENTTKHVPFNGSCPTNTVGIVNVGLTHTVGGYDGWTLNSAYPDFYPLADVHASVGDSIYFASPGGGSITEDVWLVPRAVYEDCNFTRGRGAIQLAIQQSVRLDKGGGFTWLLQEWMRREYGDILYITSAHEWNKPSSQRGCKNGMKMKVIFEDRKVLPVVTDEAIGDIDLSASDTVQDLTASIGHLSRILILSQYATENRIRSEGDSGVTNVRGSRDGNEDYDDGTYSNGNVMSMHNHANNIKVVGIGEIEAVLNGVEFKTRHNDYDLNMPHTNSSEYHATEPVPFPDVPPEVLAFGPDDVEGQIGEMQEWFRAFKWQNASHRNYTKYFKPILCYLEGTWIDEDDALTEPFESDRHHIDAKSWEELHNKVRYMDNSGRKNPRENLATLPSSIRNLVNDTYPIISNWEYRVLCAPLKNDVETSRFRISDDLSVQLMGSPETRKELLYSRRARFDLNRNLDGTEWEKGRTRRNYLDVLMEQIPGKDNYGANLTDSFPDGTSMALLDDRSGPINTGYYSRFYQLDDPDAMGTSSHRRGFSDRYLFAAQTTHSKVSPVAFDYEVDHDDGSSSTYPTVSRWSYAFPLEVIYLTPLTKWNPYNISFVDKSDFVEGLNGKCGSEPLQNIKGQYFYQTPAAFFGDDSGETDAADTAQNGLCAIGADGEEHAVAASGHWLVFPEIGGDVGFVRQRYPIPPVHEAGSAAFKEVKSLQDVILPTDYDDVETGVEFFTDTRDLEYGFNLYLEGGGHDHLVFIKSNRIFKDWYDDENLQYLNGSDYMTTADSETANGHTHTINIWRWREDADSAWNYVLDSCRFGLKSDEDVGWTNDTCADFHDTVRRDTGEDTKADPTKI